MVIEISVIGVFFTCRNFTARVGELVDVFYPRSAFLVPELGNFERQDACWYTGVIKEIEYWPNRRIARMVVKFAFHGEFSHVEDEVCRAGRQIRRSRLHVAGGKIVALDDMDALWEYHNGSPTMRIGPDM